MLRKLGQPPQAPSSAAATAVLAAFHGSLLQALQQLARPPTTDVLMLLSLVALVQALQQLTRLLTTDVFSKSPRSRSQGDVPRQSRCLKKKRARSW